VIDGKGFVPQHRGRIYLVGYIEDAITSLDEFIKTGDYWYFETYYCES